MLNKRAARPEKLADADRDTFIRGKILEVA